MVVRENYTHEYILRTMLIIHVHLLHYNNAFRNENTTLISFFCAVTAAARVQSQA